MYHWTRQRQQRQLLDDDRRSVTFLAAFVSFSLQFAPLSTVPDAPAPSIRSLLLQFAPLSTDPDAPGPSTFCTRAHTPHIVRTSAVYVYKHANTDMSSIYMPAACHMEDFQLINVVGDDGTYTTGH